MNPYTLNKRAVVVVARARVLRTFDVLTLLRRLALSMPQHLLFALTLLMSGVGYCRDQPVSGSGTKAQAATASWVPTGNLNTGRSYHTATLLRNGKVLVVGGVGAPIANVLAGIATAELYEPATGRWSLAGRPSAPRSSHTATLLQNGKVLVVWGVFSDGVGSTELYDPDTGAWSTTGSLLEARGSHTATLLQDGRVLVVGGYRRDVLGSSELYDPTTGIWTSTGSLLAGRYGHTAIQLQNGKVLVVGGSNDGDLCFNLGSAELYDPITGTWSTTSSPKIARYGHTLTKLGNSKVLATGGYQGTCQDGPVSLNGSELFDPATETWKDTGNLNSARQNHTATLLSNGDVLLAGGFDWSGKTYLDSAEIYNADRGTSTSIGNFVGARSGHTATLLPNGMVLVAGGEARTLGLNTAELSSPVALVTGTIDPGFTGAWFDPSQSGHGLFIEVLDSNRLLAWWFTFNPVGTEQAWFGGVGTYSGNTATITAVNQTTGGRWIPNFDPTQIVNNPWGTLTFNFTDCKRGRVEFNSVRGYGTGSMNLTRLTQPAGTSCP